MRDLVDTSLLHAALAKVVPAAAGVAFVAIAIRAFEPSAYGRFSLAFAGANFLGVLSVVWISQSILRFVPGESQLRPALRPILVFAALLAGVIALLAVLGSRWSGLPILAESTTGESALFVILTSALALNTAAGAAATSTQAFLLYRNAEFLRAAALVGFSLLASRASTGAAGLLGAYAVATLAPSVLLAAFVGSAAAWGAWSSLGGVLRRFMSFGWPITIWATLQAAQAFLERGVLSQRLPPAEFGEFISSADVVIRGIGLALMPVVTVLHPRVMASAGSRRTTGPVERRILRGGFLLVLAGGLVGSALLVAAKEPLALLFPGLTAVSRITVALLGLSGVAWVLALIAHKPLEIASDTFTMSKWLVVALALQLVVLIFGVEVMGATAMPVASLAAASLYMAGCTWSARKRHSDVRG